MVGNSTAKATEMALKLDTVHRWCVTGKQLALKLCCCLHCRRQRAS